MSRVTRLSIGVMLTLVVAFAIATASGAAGNLKCFAGDPATCSVSGETATLDIERRLRRAYCCAKANGKSLAKSITRSSTTATRSMTLSRARGGGSPRWSIPINTDQDGQVEGYAFIDANGCGNTGIVTTTSSACAVNFKVSTMRTGMRSRQQIRPTESATQFRSSSRHDGTGYDSDLRHRSHQVGVHTPECEGIEGSFPSHSVPVCLD